MHPLVSVVIPTYNHEKYIAESIQSVLDQTFKDFELIVVNDGSTDKTDEVIRSFDDNRIKYIYQENEGPSMASNKGILESRGKYVCLLAGDDVFYPEKLETQYKYLAKYNKKAVFSWIDIIDDDGNILEDHNVQQYFNIPNRSRAELFKSFFLKANDLCAVTIMAEKSILMDAGLMHLTSIQMQDFYMWVKLVKKHELFVIEEKLVKYRIRNKSGNLSFNPDNNIRTTFEAYQLYRDIFDDVSPDFFRECFSKQLRNPDFEGNEEYELEKAFLYINSSFPFLENSNVFEIIGAELLSKILQNKEFLDVAKSKYNFGLPELYELTKQIDVTNAKKLAQEQSQLQQTQSQLQQTQSQLQQTQSQLHQAYNDLDAIKSSKFWKLRQKWFEFRKLLGVTNDQQDFSLRSLIRTIKQETIVKKQTVLEIEQEEWDKNLPLISVVIPCYNYGKYVEEAIDSVLNQTLSDLEIIVVDDGSTDTYTIEILDNLNKPKTKVIRTTNQKLPAARNNGIKQAKGKYICCLDADDIIKPTYLEKCVVRMENENLDICYSWIKEFGDSNSIWQTRQFILEDLIHQNCCVVSAMFKSSTWKKVGGFNENMINGYEDWDFWIKIAKNGGRGQKINEPLFLYRKHGRSMIDEAQEKHELLCTEIRKNHPELYGSQSLIRKIQGNIFDYSVTNGYINITSSFADNNQKYDSLNVLFLIPYMVVGGAEKVVLEVIRTCNKANYNVSVVTTVNPSERMGDMSATYEEEVKELYQLPNLFRKESEWEDFVFYILRSRSIKIIFLAGSTYGYELLPKIKAHFPQIRIVNPIYLPYGHIDSNREFYKYIDLTILENKSLEYVMDFAISSKQKVIHNGVDIDEFKPNIEKLYPKINGDKFIISFIGRFTQQKRPDIFVNILVRLQEYKNLEFVMAGDGELYVEILKLIQKFQLEDKVSLPGFVDAKEYLSMSDLLILPSEEEGRPNIVLESLAMGVPVIASSVGGLPEIIQNAYNGFLCQSGDVDDFVNRVKEVLNNQELYLNMRRNAREYAINHLDINIMHQTYLDTFQSLVEFKKEK